MEEVKQKGQIAQAQLQLDQQATQAKLAMEQQKSAAELEHAREKAMLDAQMKERASQLDAELKARQQNAEAALAERQQNFEMQLALRLTCSTRTSLPAIWGLLTSWKPPARMAKTSFPKRMRPKLPGVWRFCWRKKLYLMYAQKNCPKKRLESRSITHKNSKENKTCISCIRINHFSDNNRSSNLFIS